MQNKQNKGFTIVEVVIALAIFVTLMVPLIFSLTSSLKKSTSAKDLQYRNEFAENLVEYAKQEKVDDVMSGAELIKAGSYDVAENASEKVKGTVEKSTDPSISADYETRVLEGSVDLGTKHTKYSYRMEISNYDYAKKEVEENFNNPNYKKMGVVEDLDHTKLALINGTIANYDKSVADEFLAKKIAILRDYSPIKYKQYISSETQTDIFSNDKATRVITIKVSKDSTTNEYIVDCYLRYHDDSKIVLDGGKNMSTYLKDEYRDYHPYTARFDELPNIYLMYNTCVYNGMYADKDYIVFDLGGISGTDTVVNAFIVQTAEAYSETVAEVLGYDASSLPPDLVYKEKYGITERKDVPVYIAATTTSKLSDGAGTKYLNVYHNFGVEPEKDDAGNIKTDASGKIIYKPNKKSDKFSFTEIGNLEPGKYKSLADANWDVLNKASQYDRGLFSIKVWMVEGEITDIDKTQDPIISGTRGGDET